MTQKLFSRREFLKLASLSVLSLAAQPVLIRSNRLSISSLPPNGQGGLSAEQLARLLEASRLFLAPDAASARQAALDIDFIEGRNEDASTMCGPLAIAILQAAELLGPWARVHDFWLLNPRQNSHPLEYTFPTDQYFWLDFDEPISKFDFNATPLLAGDLVYLQAGPGDTFEHVLIVNRVDENGRPYSVTNFFTAEGTIIEERLLYDPARPDAGQFKAWANRSIRNTLGNTGSAGFRIWRVKNGRSLEFPSDPPTQELRAFLDQTLLAAAGTWYAAIKKVGGAKLYQFNPYEPFHPASTIKVPIAMAFYHWLESQKLGDWQRFIQEKGTAGRVYAQLLEAMIVESEEDATEALVDFLGKNYLEKIWGVWGLKYTRADPRRSSASEIIRIFERLYQGSWIVPESRAHLLNMMAAFTSNDDTRLGTLRPRLPAGSIIYNKRGSLVDWPRVVGDSAIIQVGQASARNAYLISLHGVGKDKAGYDDLEATFSQAVEILGNFLKEAG